MAIVAIGIVTFGLYAGREVFVPLALALLLSVALLPVTRALQKLGLPRVPAVLIVLVLTLAVLAGALVVLAGQAISLAADMPNYEATLRTKLQALSGDSDSLDRLVRMAQRLEHALTPASLDGGAASVVTVAPAPVSPLAAVGVVLAAILSPVASLAIALLLLTFILVGHEDARDRFLRLAGTHDLHRTTRAMADATQRVGRYLLMQLVVNAIFGTCMATGLWLIGLPNAPLWGLLGFALRFVPYLGGPLSALFPLVIAVLTTDGWTSVLLVLGLFVTVDILCSYVLEPMLYGRSIGISPLALIVSSALWTVVWGPVGLILAPPITACLAIIGRHVPSLSFLEVLFGDATPLPAPVRFYQRLLARDPDGAEAIAEEVQEASDSRAMLEQLVFPTLESLREDRRAGVLAADAAAQIANQVGGLVAELTDEEETEAAAAPAAVAVLPVGGALDRAAAEATAAFLRQGGLDARRATALDGTARALVLVSMEQPSGPRLRRAVVVAGRGGVPVQLLSLAPSDPRAMIAGGAGEGVGIVHSRDALLAALRGQRGVAAAPRAGTDAAAPKATG